MAQKQLTEDILRRLKVARALEAEQEAEFEQRPPPGPSRQANPRLKGNPPAFSREEWNILKHRAGF